MAEITQMKAPMQLKMRRCIEGQNREINLLVQALRTGDDKEVQDAVELRAHCGNIQDNSQVCLSDCSIRPHLFRNSQI